MTDNRIDKIRAEIESRYNYHRDHADDWAGTEHFWSAKEDRELLNFIYSMQEEPVSEDLENEIVRWEDSFKYCPASMGYKETAIHFFELGMSVSNKAQKGEKV